MDLQTTFVWEMKQQQQQKHFCIEKCDVLIMKKRKRKQEKTKGIELLNQKSVRTRGEK